MRFLIRTNKSYLQLINGRFHWFAFVSLGYSLNHLCWPAFAFILLPLLSHLMTGSAVAVLQRKQLG
jgi:hypothetical protein